PYVGKDTNCAERVEDMNQEQFENECKKPVDLDECYEALQRLINREHTLHVPARPDDEDMLLSRALRELKENRERLPRESVQWFAEQMEAALRHNDHKGGWDNENIYWLWERLKEEASELLVAIDATRDLYADPLNIVLEAAGVANFAMMIADIARKKLKL
ncbi:hypothetical protein, partial [Paenibacillus rhizolycopersici]|uniref:hypothetical protein n=1 Tax=Paenibacillus rhizolycopersici TaxID=2780073 RepID=UPI003D2AE142